MKITIEGSYQRLLYLIHTPIEIRTLIDNSKVKNRKVTPYIKPKEPFSNLLLVALVLAGHQHMRIIAQYTDERYLIELPRSL